MSLLHSCKVMPATYSMQIARGLKITRNNSATPQIEPKQTLNGDIKAFMVRILDADGTTRTLHTRFAVDEALNKGMDLLVIDDKTNPPLCKILDYAKFKFHQKHKKKSTKAQAKHKELRFGYKIEEHDVNVKVKQLEHFLLKKIRVKVSITFEKGEADQALAEAMIENLFERVSSFTKKRSSFTNWPKSCIRVFLTYS